MDEGLRVAESAVRKSAGSLTGNKDMQHEGEAEAQATKLEGEAGGAIDQAVGKVQETVGDLTGDTENELRGKTRQEEGNIGRAG